MSSRHEQALSRTDDLGVIHSYAYGALKEMLRQLDAGLLGAIPFTEKWKELIAAVEFRTAEVAAERLLPEVQALIRRSHLTLPPAETITTPIYEDDIPHNGDDDLM